MPLEVGKVCGSQKTQPPDCDFAPALLRRWGSARHFIGSHGAGGKNSSAKMSQEVTNIHKDWVAFSVSFVSFKTEALFSSKGTIEFWTVLKSCSSLSKCVRRAIPTLNCLWASYSCLADSYSSTSSRNWSSCFASKTRHQTELPHKPTGNGIDW